MSDNFYNNDSVNRRFWLNGEVQIIPDKPWLLIDYLRDHLHLTGTKAACREGDCGSCQVLLSDHSQADVLRYRAQTSCLSRVQDIENHHLITIEGLRNYSTNSLSQLQKILADNGASQCGFCSPGLTMGALNWLLNGKALTIEEGEHWINGNLCRCTGYMGQRRAIAEIVSVYAEALMASRDRLQTLIDLELFPQFSTMPLLLEASNKILGGGTDRYLHQPVSMWAKNEVCKTDNDELVFKETQNSLILNACVPIQQIAEALEVAGKFSAFKKFNHLFASLPVRNQATLGGNLANASPIGDGITFLMALDATVCTNLQSVSINDFFIGFKQTVLKPGEIIQWVEIPLSQIDSCEGTPKVHVTFDKVSRRGTTDIAVVNCAASWQLENGIVKRALLVVGGASPIPVRLPTIEKAMVGLCINDINNSAEKISHYLNQSLQEYLSPISDQRGSANYRRLLANQLVLAQWHNLAELHGGNSDGA